MKVKFFIFLFFVVIATTYGCLESKKLPAPNEIKIITPEPTLPPIEQKLPSYNETKFLKINGTFETWSRGYWSNSSYGQPYFRVILNYSEWTAFVDEQKRIPSWLEGQLFPGVGKSPKTIEPDNFNNYFIIAAMMGRIGIAEGPEIEIKNISRLNNVVNVTVYMYKLGPGAMVESAPYHIVIVKKEILTKGNSTFVFIDTEGKELEKVKIKPSIKLAYVPTNLNSNSNFTIRWEVSGGTSADINYTAVHWGYESGSANMSDYPRVSRIQTGKTPMEFTADINAPAGGILYIRVYAIVDGVQVYSPEYQIRIK